MSALDVWYGQARVGELRDGDPLRFAYDPRWAKNGFAISISMPLREDPYLAPTFFSNLLPEGALRQAICTRFHISYDNDFALLAAIGGECAGALSLLDPGGSPPKPDEWAYDALPPKKLQALLSNEIPLLVGGATTRLSLAGAQDKVPVAMLDGKLHLPTGNAPSTHILKLPSARWAHLPINEGFALGLAARIGFDVAPAKILPQTDPPSLLVERYDRRRSDDPWPAIRLHQEDMCQALGFPPSRKYEHEGGPTFAQIVEVVRRNVTRPLVDVPRLLRWQAFNVVVGNSDAHAKNLAILYADDEARLAPFYDIVSTREYDRIERDLAMSIGKRRNPDELHREQWATLARELEIAEHVVIDLVRDVAETSLASIDGWARDFHDENGEQPILSTLPRAVKKRARALMKRLES